MKKTLKRSTYKLNKNRKLIKNTRIIKKKFKKGKNIKKQKKTRKNNYRKKYQKGGFIQLPFMNNSESVLVNAMCNQLDETELANNPRKVDGFVNSLCHKKKLSGGAEANEGGVLGIVKNITSVATAPLRTIMNVVTGGSKQPAPIVTQPQVNIQPVPIVTQPTMANLNHNLPVSHNIVKKKNIARGLNNKKIQIAGSSKKKKIKLPKL